MKKLKIACICGFGVGTSLILKMTIDEVLAGEGIEAENDSHDMTSLGGTEADVVFTSGELADQIGEIMDCPIVVIENFIDASEVREKGLGLIRELMRQ
jgi:PTS system ascorbate-specific IIB component